MKDEVPAEPADDVLMFWGKAREATGINTAYHPVAFHSLDVAACLKQILEVRPITLARGARLIGLPVSVAIQFLTTFAALHDIGKFGIAFQAKRPDLWPRLLGDFSGAAKSVHTSDGYLLWDQVLASNVIPRLWPEGSDVLHDLAPAIFGHHGRPVACSESIVKRVLGAQSVVAAQACTSALLDLLQATPISVPVDTDLARSRVASWWVAGLVTLADWLGSNEEIFAYQSPNPDVDLSTNLQDYWQIAQTRAKAAVRNAGLMPPKSASLHSFANLTGITEPTPAQKWASTVVIPSGPVLFILEDVTGSGKTEAAQMLVHRLMVSEHASGAYWAMPTQATANAMYERQGNAIANLFDEDEGIRPSLVLAHGQARLHSGFRASVLGSSDVTGKTVVESSDTELPSGTACAAFLANDRRTSLLADIGAGTIDQAVLGVLPSRFNTLRLFALSEKVLVIDEAHAYDAYVTKELETLLKFHAALGGSAVVLSATLSSGQRAKLIDAWVDGASDDIEEVERSSSKAYPLATTISGVTGAVEETPIDAALWSHRKVAVRFLHSEEAIVDEILQGAQIGATVAWVRNSVGDCMRAARVLRDRGLDPIVFHARFAQCDRQAREHEILRLFGKDRKNTDARRIVVATQVIEQSLDISFDMMFSDVAPIDLLIQRAGRLQRHSRLKSRTPVGLTLELVVLAPPMELDPPEDWLKALLPATAYVYNNTGVIWRTVRALTEAKCIETPGEIGRATSVRRLVEDVYGDDYVPPNLEAATIMSEGKASAARATATYGTLVLGDGYNAYAKGWVDDIRVPTRLGKEQTVIRLALVMPNGAMIPWAESVSPGDPPGKKWALSEVRVPALYIPSDAEADPSFSAAIANVRLELGKYEQDIPVLPLTVGEDGIWEGDLITRQNGRAIRVNYSGKDGLSVE
jgi:CRISPR-associated endonuclease/helicase Cas3